MRPIDADTWTERIDSDHCASCSRLYPCSECGLGIARESIDNTPTLDVMPVVHGEWTEKEVATSESSHIDAWQSTKCSVCGRYHTTPYMYYFDDYNFCPHCGAKMDGEGKDK